MRSLYLILVLAVVTSQYARLTMVLPANDLPTEIRVSQKKQQAATQQGNGKKDQPEDNNNQVEMPNNTSARVAMPNCSDPLSKNLVGCLCLSPTFLNPLTGICQKNCDLIQYSMGPNSSKEDECLCIRGYFWNNRSRQCQINCSMVWYSSGPEPDTNNRCRCQNKYQFRLGRCWINCQSVSKSIGRNRLPYQCICQAKYQWNDESRQCVSTNKLNLNIIILVSSVAITISLLTTFVLYLCAKEDAQIDGRKLMGHDNQFIKIRKYERLCSWLSHTRIEIATPTTPIIFHNQGQFVTTYVPLVMSMPPSPMPNSTQPQQIPRKRLPFRLYHVQTQRNTKENHIYCQQTYNSTPSII